MNSAYSSVRYITQSHKRKLDAGSVNNSQRHAYQREKQVDVSSTELPGPNGTISSTSMESRGNNPQCVVKIDPCEGSSTSRNVGLKSSYPNRTHRSPNGPNNSFFAPFRGNQYEAGYASEDLIDVDDQFDIDDMNIIGSLGDAPQLTTAHDSELCPPQSSGVARTTSRFAPRNFNFADQLERFAIRDATLDVFEAGKIFLRNRHSGQLNERVYQDAISSEVCSSVCGADSNSALCKVEDAKGVLELKQTMRCYVAGQQIAMDILFAKTSTRSTNAMVKTEKFAPKRKTPSRRPRPEQKEVRVKPEFTPNISDVIHQSNYPGLQASIGHLLRVHTTPADGHFQPLCLNSILQSWLPKNKEKVYAQLADAFRTILMQITDPPNAIQRYTVRSWTNRGRRRELSDLPDAVDASLMEFGVDLLGLGHSELDPRSYSPEDLIDVPTAYWESLGTSDEERTEQWKRLVAVAEDWKAKMKPVLQKSMNDIRAFLVTPVPNEHGEIEYVWKSNKKHRPTVDVEEDVHR